MREKLRAPALRVLTTISWVARTLVWAGAMRVSWATGWPSAVMETQDVLEAWMSRVKAGMGFGGLDRG